MAIRPRRAHPSFDRQGQSGKRGVSTPTRMVFALPLDELEAVPQLFGLSLTPAERALMLARALSASPVWREMGDAVLIVRSAPTVLGLIGEFDEPAIARLSALPHQLRTEVPRLRYVAYPQVEADCEALAAGLIERLGREEIGHMDFMAIPRGGLIVLGMLAYFLDLKPSQLTATTHGERGPLIVVDDCSVSGIRFGQTLATLPDRPVVFAPLYSHPALRSAIEAREAKVVAVVSARDLTDHAPTSLGSDYAAWRERWAARPGHEGYWIGRPDRLCFPWSEVDLDFWNPAAGYGEVAWRLVPPELCLKNRVAAAGPHAPRVQLQRQGKGPLGPSPTALFAELDDGVVVANFESGEAVQLSDVAAVMWRGIVEHGNPEDVVASLRAEYDVGEDVLKRNLASLIEEMERRGFLARTHVAATS